MKRNQPTVAPVCSSTFCQSPVTEGSAAACCTAAIGAASPSNSAATTGLITSFANRPATQVSICSKHTRINDLVTENFGPQCGDFATAVSAFAAWAQGHPPLTAGDNTAE